MVEEMSQLFQSHPLSLFLEKTISREDEMNSEEKEKEGEEDSEKEEKENKKEESSDKTESSQKEDREEEKSEKEAREEEEEEEEESSYDFHVTTDQESRTDRSVDSPLITTSSSALTPERASFGLPGPASFSCSSLPSSSSSSSLSSSSSSLSSSPSSSLSSFSSSKLEDIPPKKAQKPGSVHDKVALLSKEMTFGRPPPSPLVGMSSSPSTSSPVIATLATPVSPSTPSKKRIASLGFGKIKKQNSTKDARASLKKSKKGKDNEAMTLSTGMSQPNLLKRDPSPRRQSVGSEREKEKEKKKKVVVDGSMPNYGLFQKHSLQEVKRKLIRVEGSKRYKDDSLMNKKGGSFNLIRTGHMNEDDDEEEEEEELDPKKKLKFCFCFCFYFFIFFFLSPFLPFPFSFFPLFSLSPFLPFPFSSFSPFLPFPKPKNKNPSHLLSHLSPPPFLSISHPENKTEKKRFAQLQNSKLINKFLKI